jgi:hypothetical protein
MPSSSGDTLSMPRVSVLRPAPMDLVGQVVEVQAASTLPSTSAPECPQLGIVDGGLAIWGSLLPSLGDLDPRSQQTRCGPVYAVLKGFPAGDGAGGVLGLADGLLGIALASDDLAEHATPRCHAGALASPSRLSSTTSIAST